MSNRMSHLPAGDQTAQSSSCGAHGLGLRLVAFWEGGTASASISEGQPLLVGRSRECDVVIDHPSVSRRHARFLAHPRPELEDLGSANGTRVAGVRLVQRRPAAVGPGDLIELGSAVLFLQSGVPLEAGGGEVGKPPPAASGKLSPAVIEDPKMRAIDRLVQLVAPNEISVLLLGETGVGKEVFAERIRHLSRRSEAPFVRINCAALTEGLIESELFGHARGAFTGAVTTKRGLLEAADGGTLFLDEVAELPSLTQSKLLRVLESGEVLRVGDLAPRKVDVRIVAATNRDLGELVQAARFRADLYFRLNGISITIPPLRERSSEIIALAELFLGLAARRAGRSPPHLSPGALQSLQAYSWPGNVRELRNVIERAAILAAEGRIGPEHVILDAPMKPVSGGDRPPARRGEGAGISEPGPRQDGLLRDPRPTSQEGTETISVREVTQAAEGPATMRSGGLREDIEEVEKRHILAALEQCNWNQSRAAILLGISRRTLTNRLNAFKLPRPRKKSAR